MNRIKAIWILVNGILAGIGLAILFRSCRQDNTLNNRQAKEMVKQIQKESEQSEKKFLAKIDSLDKRSAALSNDVRSLNLLLQNAKAANSHTQASVTERVKKISPAIDTAEYYVQCDSLKNEALLLITEAKQKDSLYELTIQKKDEQIMLKDSSLQLHRQQYAELKGYFTRSITQQQQLLAENSLLNKKLRRQKTKARLLGGLTAVVAGFTAHYLITH